MPHHLEIIYSLPQIFKVNTVGKDYITRRHVFMNTEDDHISLDSIFIPHATISRANRRKLV